MKTFKKILFFILLPIVGLSAFVFNTVVSEKDKPQWFMKIWGKEGNYFERLLGVLFSPLVLVMFLILKFGFSPWEGLLD